MCKEKKVSASSIFEEKTVKNSTTFAGKIQEIGRSNSLKYRKLGKEFEASTNHGPKGKKKELISSVQKAVAVQKKRGLKLLEKDKEKRKQEKRIA